MTIEECSRMAAEHGGTCLSRRYVNARAKLRWRCGHGHEWKAAWTNIQSGHWCPTCARGSPYSIDDMQTFAARRNGACISTTYVNSYTKLRWRCAEGHTWEATPRLVLGGTWCPRCALREPWTLERLRVEARNRGGECLGETEEHGRFRFRCQLGHKWSGRIVNVASGGSWCPVCAGVMPLTLHDLRKTARERGGRCLAEVCLGTAISVEWECRKRHRWSAKPATIRSGSWCPECAIERRRGSSRAVVTLEDMHELARQHNGKCLSSLYVNAKTKLQWQCAQGHRFRALSNTVRRGSWCARCAGVAKFTIADMQTLAKARGGRCLSPEYLGTRAELHWRCAHGHTFWASPAKLKAIKSFCPECREQKPWTLAEMRALAARHRGKCLSAEYVNAITPLSWRCAKGHVWSSAPRNIKGGSWCPLCRVPRSPRKTLIERLESL
jgi:hypothetical protein